MLAGERLEAHLARARAAAERLSAMRPVGTPCWADVGEASRAVDMVVAGVEALEALLTDARDQTA